MPPKGKSKAKAVKNSPKTATPISIDPPAPFTRPSSNLNEFLPTLSKEHVYITHIDRKPRDFKQKIFMVPVLFNILILAGLVWRIRSVGPVYMNILYSLTGGHNTTVDFRGVPWGNRLPEIYRRAIMFMIDLLVYSFIWPWPREFFVGQRIGNPISWRIGVGFRDNEIIVRRSKKWDMNIGNVLDEESQGHQLLLEKVRKAVDPLYMNEKTGYLMLNKDWDLDWKSMVQATKLVDKKLVALDDFRTTVLVHHENFGWMAAVDASTAGENTKELNGRRKIVAFKDELTALGKENLFFRWIELVQFDSSQPGGFGPEQQLKTMAKARAMFEDQGVDFDQFWEKLGGMQGLPGMDQL